MDSLIPLIPFLPLIGFVINGLFGKNLPKSVVGIIGSGTLLVSFLLSIWCFNEVGTSGAIHVRLYNFFTVDGLQVDFGFLIDHLSVWMMLIVTGIGFLIHVYSIGYMHDDDGFWKFFAYLNLFIFSMLLLVMGDNFLMLFFGWEGVGLCSYLLIGFWYTNKEYGKAARKAFIMNRIGDLGLLLGMFMIFKTFGSLNYEDIFSRMASIRMEMGVITTICILLFIGAMGKSAQLPLYTWLPDAMAGPTPVSALIHAATMVTAGIYLVARCNPLYSLSPDAMHFVASIGLITCIFAAVIGLRQNDIKKILAYSTVSQLGLMFVALGMGAYASAMFHVTTHAFFKALLFLGAGSVIHGMGGEQDIRKMGGLRKAMPITFWVFLIGTFAISGFPLLSGFFSKDEILAFTYAHGGMVWWVLAGLSAMLTAVYMSRLLYLTFFGAFRGTTEQEHHLHESPATMTVPLAILAGLSLAGGFLNTPHFMHLGNSQWMAHWFSWVIPMQEVHLGESTEWMLMIVTTSMAVAVLIISYFIYTKKSSVPVPDAEQKGLTRVIAHKFYVDEIYDFLFVRPLERLSRLFHYYVDMQGIDGLVNGVGSGVQKLGAGFRKLQNGNIEYYLIGMVAGVILLLLTLFI
ncbi:MAG TPA: NADH-quinone oxidoreductase subunit L [Saprospiraceae bacterium]|nr:NADH-quinone oxidoreductase subunit L [Saprospiraceae bacterium]HPI08108.1 NADH-quinone oxidoreductase subunit L [Saprospiraceae bacterium]